MKTSLIFATNNVHKLEEVRAMLSDAYPVRSLADMECREDIPETADTLEGNALQKALFVKTQYGFDCFADDTGLEVAALNNEPGVYSARYAGETKDSQANRRKLLQNLADKTDRSARFRTVIALIKDGQQHLFDGIVEGEISTEERGDTGFGYDSIFVPTGYTQTFAELGNDIKNTISHRAAAIQQLKQFLDHEK